MPEWYAPCASAPQSQQCQPSPHTLTVMQQCPPSQLTAHPSTAARWAPTPVTVTVTDGVVWSSRAAEPAWDVWWCLSSPVRVWCGTGTLCTACACASSVACTSRHVHLRRRGWLCVCVCVCLCLRLDVQGRHARLGVQSSGHIAVSARAARGPTCPQPAGVHLWDA